MAKSPANTQILATRLKQVGELPAYVTLGHRHLEKGTTDQARNLGSSLTTFIIPVDMMRTCGMPDQYVNEVESIELTYGRK